MNERNQQQVDMTYWKLREYFRAAERQGQHLTSNNKAFQPNMGGYSIYASSLDGSDPLVRLEQYMAAERGGKDGWQVERCYMMADELERAKDLLKNERRKDDHAR